MRAFSGPCCHQEPATSDVDVPAVLRVAGTELPLRQEVAVRRPQLAQLVDSGLGWLARALVPILC
jgi:hypothetical protein